MALIETGGKQELGQGPHTLKACDLPCLRLRRRWGKRPSATWRRSARTTEPSARRTRASWGGSGRPEELQRRSAPGMGQGAGMLGVLAKHLP